ncbi:hypothetical protein PYCCODRAFT_1434068 [Trametes coccinea BRFM310]|uniref:C2H2-type domain-containing protein n=1 Tax=Trametes coccinea (strain BRFM310) TaxID=1353009 RepID=A0A1Y2ISS2_TRAC3|nr:hypothetical protein PYCCODRAFT_1434068 [Trametes coccinea BRFM310]
MASSINLPDFDFSNTGGEDYNDAEEYDDGEEGEEYDEGEDLEAEAEEMARRLGDQLLADIAKAQAEAAAAAFAAPAENSIGAPPTETHEHHAQAEASQPSPYKKKQDAALLTMKAILAFASKNPVVQSAMSTSQVPGTEGANLLDVFNRCIAASSISKPLARTLTEIVLSLAKSEVLFGSLRNSDAPAIQLDKGKRKRDQADEGGRHAELGPGFPQKRVAIQFDQPDLLHHLSEAVRIISHALSSAPAHRQSIDPALISSIQLQLHQVFLFAVTSAPRAVDGRMPALQELAGLVQMLGVLSGIHIGNPAMHPPSHWHMPPDAAPPPPDIGTAVYPCLVPGCNKTFHRLYSLRTHQRFHTLEHRPYRCMHCPASFVRNHDLKRHALLHEKKAWRCAGCNKIFSRRDAIKRHKDARGRAGGKSRPGEADPVDTACAYAEIEEVEVEKADGDEEMSRRAKLWNGIAASTAASMSMGEHGPEEGEIDPAIVFEAQNIVLSIHGLLQAEVAKGLGPPAAPAPMPPPHVSQSTLASIIARAQQTVVPQEIPVPPPPAPEQPPEEHPRDEPMVVDEPAPPPPSEAQAGSERAASSSTPPPLSLSWLSEEQTRLLEQAIAQAASAAQAQAEAEAALEEEEEEEFDEDDEQDQEGAGE